MTYIKVNTDQLLAVVWPANLFSQSCWGPLGQIAEGQAMPPFLINPITTHTGWRVSAEQLLEGRFINLIMSEPEGMCLAETALLAVVVSVTKLMGDGEQVQFINYNESTKPTNSIGKPFQNQNGLERLDALTFLMIYDATYMVVIACFPLKITSDISVGI